VETYRKLVIFLKRACPPEHPVSVRRLKLSERLDGDCQFKEGHFRVRINRNLPEHEAIETLLHEWAHTIAWDKCHSDEHCDEWGKAYSRVYRAFLKGFIDNKD
jgi:hypothetical protein